MVRPYRIRRTVTVHGRHKGHVTCGYSLSYANITPELTVERDEYELNHPDGIDPWARDYEDEFEDQDRIDEADIESNAASN